MKTRIKLYLPGDTVQTTEDSIPFTLFRCFLNEFASINVSNSFAPCHTLFNYLLDSMLKFYHSFPTNF